MTIESKVRTIYNIGVLAVTLGTVVYSLNITTNFYNDLEKSPIVQDINKLVKEGKYKLSKLDIEDYFTNKKIIKKGGQKNERTTKKNRINLDFIRGNRGIHLGFTSKWN